MTNAESGNPALGLVHLLRAVTVEFDLLAGEFAGRHGLHPTDLRALICLLDADRAGETVTPGLLGSRLRLNSAGTTALVDRLERLGLVRRERDGRDRRRVLLTVDARAVELGRAFFGPLIGDLVGAAAELDEAGLAAVRRYLTAALAAATAARGPGAGAP
jgi:DNA-binding MarR family transcriptional regulator